MLPLLFALVATLSARPERPNILWLTSEDHGPHMGCYGDSDATTPNVDALAERGLRYDFVWSTLPVCAPARTTIISGLYPSSTGAEHMRSMLPAPAGKPFYPVFLREAGYYCTNNSKEDYNLEQPAELWDASSRDAHWKNRADGQPFFAIFNATISHESRIRNRPHTPVHDPAEATLAPYWPDTPEVRRDWAQYYDRVSEADAVAGAHLADLEAAGLADETIVFYYADHGSGMPGHKRCANDAGLRVPLVVYIPEKYAHLRSPEYTAGGASQRLVGFIDLAPTVLSLAGIRPPAWMQGHAFLGAFTEAPPAYLHGLRGRMDERRDFVRTITDGRFLFIRNFRPDLPLLQHVAYMFQTPTTRVWKELFDAGQLNADQARAWLPRPAEELYDLQTDPHALHNLADDPSYGGVKARLRSAQWAFFREIHDVGFLPEGELHSRVPGTSPYDFARDRRHYPLTEIHATAELAMDASSNAIPALRMALAFPDSAVRYWAAQGLAYRATAETRELLQLLRESLDDTSPYVRLVAVQSLVRHGDTSMRAAALDTLAELADPSEADFFVSLEAVMAIENLGDRAASLHPLLRRWPEDISTAPNRRYASYIPRLLADALGE